MSPGQCKIFHRIQTWHLKGTCGEGFTLIEVLLAIMILNFGLLSAGQLIYSTLSSHALARSKQSAVLIAQSKLELLITVYNRNPDLADLQMGDHGPEEITIFNPIENTPLNRFEIRWIVAPVPDLRKEKKLKAKKVTVIITPIGSGTETNIVAYQNKAVSISSILSPKA